MEDTLNHLKILNVLSPRGFHIPNCDKKGFYKKKQVSTVCRSFQWMHFTFSASLLNNLASKVHCLSFYRGTSFRTSSDSAEPCQVGTVFLFSVGHDNRFIWETSYLITHGLAGVLDTNALWFKKSSASVITHRAKCCSYHMTAIDQCFEL